PSPRITVSPNPSWPLALTPRHLTRPPSSSTQAWFDPVTMGSAALAESKRSSETSPAISGAGALVARFDWPSQANWKLPAKTRTTHRPSASFALARWIGDTEHCAVDTSGLLRAPGRVGL